LRRGKKGRWEERKRAGSLVVARIRLSSIESQKKEGLGGKEGEGRGEG